VTEWPASTLDGVQSRRQDVVGVWWRRAFLSALAVVVGAGLLGLLGVRTATASAEADGWQLSVDYPGTARAGLDVPWTATVRHEDGLGDQVTLALTGTYLDLFETQGFNPEPSATTRDADTLLLTFDAPPEGDTLVVTYDTYVQPSAQRGADATLAVRSDQRDVVSVDLHTRLVP
jgi:hypothetical protein